MNEDYKLDRVDKAILKYLIENARMPFTEIAKILDVSAGTIHVRLKKLEEAGIISGTTLKVDYENLGYRFVAYVGIILTKTDQTQKVLDALYKIPSVTVAHVIAGKYNIFCKIRAKDTLHAKDIIFSIDQIPGVLRTETTISLGESFNDRRRLMKEIFK